MNRLDHIRRLLSEPAVRRGTIIDITGDTAQIATRAGGMTARISPGLILQIGAHVEIQGQLIVGTVRNPADLPVYEL